MIGALAALALAGEAAAQVEVQDNYPSMLSRPVLSAWLRNETDLTPEQVVAVSSSAATAVVGRTPMQGGRSQARLRAVAITRKAVAHGGVLAWEMQLDVDCKSRQVRAGATTGYATRRGGGGEGLLLAPADGIWRTPKDGTILDASWRAVCDAKFRSPLTEAPLQIAEARPSPAPSPPASTTTAGSPAIAARNVASAAVPSAALVTPTGLTRAAPAQPSRPKARPEPQVASLRKPAHAEPSHPAVVRTAAKAGPNAVQVISSPNEADTRRKLDRLQRRFGPDLQEGVEIRVVQAQVSGQKVYRGVVAGFATRHEARAFCQTLKQGGQDCVSW